MLRDEEVQRKPNAPVADRSWKSRRYTGQVLHPLQARRDLAEHGRFDGSQRAAFEIFRLWARAQRLHRELKSRRRQRRRQQLLDGLDQAESAAKRGDSHAFYGFVRWLLLSLTSLKSSCADLKISYWTRKPSAECSRSTLEGSFRAPAWTRHALTGQVEERASETQAE